jgi:hypothetical protein
MTAVVKHAVGTNTKETVLVKKANPAMRLENSK